VASHGTPPPNNSLQPTPTSRARLSSNVGRKVEFDLDFSKSPDSLENNEEIKEIAFVCCAVSDMSRARAFYEGILGLKPNAPVGPDPIASSTTSAPERSQSKGTRIGPFLPTACQLHLKSTTSKALSDTCANTISPSSSDRLKRKFAIGRRFAIPTGIAWSFTSESESGAIPWLNPLGLSN